MFGLEILDIAVGLVLTYLLLCLILTSVQEALEWWFKSRAVDLEKAIGEILQGDRELVQKFYDHPLIYALYQGKGPANPDNGAAQSASGTLSGLPASQLPSYIPRETFSAALLDLLETGQSNDRLMRALTGLRRYTVGNTPEALRRELEGWYDAAMDRASGWYKRRTQRSLFVMGALIAVLLNVNSVTIARQLAADEQSRVYANQLATKITRKDTPPADKDVLEFHDQVKRIGIPIGWDDQAGKKLLAGLPQEPSPWGNGNWEWADGGRLLAWIAALAVLLLGYLTTAFAVMLGAPFWFDVLNRIMVIRSTIKPHEKSPDEPSEEGGKKAGTDRPPDPAPGQQLAGAGAPAGFGAMPGVGMPAAAMPVDAGDERDGCLDGHAIDDGMETDDVELPPATGGIESVERRTE